MSDNPFESLGGAGGGFDFQGLLQQAQQMQEQLENAQKKLADARVDGTVAGGSVVVTVNGIGELVEVKIRAGGFDGSSDDDLSDLGDLIVAAYRDAKAQADSLAAGAIGPLSGGIPGLGGPAGGDGPEADPGSLGFSQED
jgi:DNA-binding protein YbaB